MTWRDEAACRGRDPQLWFPVLEDHGRQRETQKVYCEALRICHTCAVQQACLEYALEARESFGMWGGKTRPERETILRQRRRDARLRG